MNVCLVSREYPPETGWGGVGTYTYHLAHGLAQRGHRVHVLAQGLTRGYEERDGDVVVVHRVFHEPLLVRPSRLREWTLRAEYSYHVSRKLKQIITQHEIDVVETPNYSGEGFVYGWRKLTPLVTRLHTHFSETACLAGWRRTLDTALSCAIEDAAILGSDLIICSTKTHAELVAREIGFDASRVELIPLGVPLPTLESSQPHLDVPHPAVLFVGRLEKRKGVHVLIKAIPQVLRMIPTLHVFLIGRDTYDDGRSTALDGQQSHSFQQALLRDLPSECVDRVHFLGHVEPHELARYYRACDVCVAPSLYESFGFIYIEAMSYGKPVIGCCVGGVPEVIEDELTGLLVRPEDPSALAEAMVRLLRDPELRHELGLRARKRVEERFSQERMVDRTLSAYEQLI